MRLIDGDALKQTFCAECTHTLKCSDCDIDYHFEKLAPTIQRWIPCSERLPEDKQRIIIQMYNGYMEIIEFSAVGLTDHILAWMPLPEPYKEGSDD